jgi:hypothetical protein
VVHAVADLILVRSMRVFGIAVVFLLLRSSTLAQATSITPAPPQDIPAEKWIAISPTLGFVVTEDARLGGIRFSTDPATGKQTAERTASPSSAVRGYFMVLRNGQWLRLESEPPPARVLDAQHP